MNNFEDNNLISNNDKTEQTNDLENNNENLIQQKEQFVCIHKGRRKGKAAHRKCNNKCLIPVSVYKQNLIAEQKIDPNQEFVCKYLKNGNIPYDHTYCTPLCFKEAKYLPTALTNEQIKTIKKEAVWIIVLTILWVCLTIVTIIVGLIVKDNFIYAMALGISAVVVWFIENFILFALKKQLKIRNFNASEYQDYTEPKFVTREFSRNFKLTGLLFFSAGIQFAQAFVSGGGLIWTLIMLFVTVALIIVLLAYSVISSFFNGFYIGSYLLKNAKADA